MTGIRFSYGIPLTAPFILFALWSGDRDALVLKTGAMALVLSVTLLFPYWAGDSGPAGDRFLAGYLLMLLPEVGKGFKHLLDRHRAMAMVVLLLVVAFLPVSHSGTTLRSNMPSVALPTSSSLIPSLGAWCLGIPKL